MTHRNNKRNNRHDRQRNNKTELSPFASMLFGALLGKGTEMIAEKMAEGTKKKTPGIHAEGITNKDINNINNGNATLSKLRIPADGSAVEYPVPDNLQFFFAEDGKLMVRKKIEGDEKPTKDDEGNPITYDDICKKLFLHKRTYWVYDKKIENNVSGYITYNDLSNCTSTAQAKRLAAFNKLQNIAKYLNKGWEPDFSIYDKKWGIIKDKKSFTPKFIMMVNDANIYFRSKDLANEAIRIMGEESLNDLFSTDW